MGVPKFYRWTSERYPCLSEVINESQIPEFDNLYLDMNGIIHNCSHPNDDDVTFRITEEEIFVNIFAYIENLYNLIKPQKVFFMAVDGVAPRAKMNQQRARRFMSARTAHTQLEQARAKGEVIPDEKRFDSNCITPGTYFMTSLHQRLEEWVNKKSVSDSRWQGRKIILSGHNVPGEGEHKIMDFIRSERASSGYDPNTRHCMYGLDADLIMLGIVSHEPHFSLLREEVTFNTRPRKNEKTKKPKRTDSDVKTFHLLHLSLLREYLAWEFADVKEQLPFAYDMERIVDDWIMMGLLVGNDFLPHLPSIHIHDDALPLLYSTYKKVLPTLDGYINESGYLNLARFEKFLAQLALNDKNSFMDKLEDMDFMESKRIRVSDEEETESPEEELVAFESSDIEDEADDEDEEKEDSGGNGSDDDAAFVSDHEEEDVAEKTSGEDLLSALNSDDLLLEDEFNDELATLALSGMNDDDFANNVEACWTKTLNNQFKRHKKSYYSDKLRYKNISKAELRAQAEGYVRAIQWNLHYYYHGCVSWSWFYPHHYAPFISDVQGFADMKIEFDLSAPFHPFEQLLAVLPEASADCLPRPLQELMSSDPAQSVISDFYPAKFDTDLNGKRNDWEAVVLIPFIDEKRLLEAIESKRNRLSREENIRNTHGCHIQVMSSRTPEGTWEAHQTELSQELFRIPKEQVKWGLLPNVKMDVYFPGFPTMKHLNHTGTLKFANCNIFGMASRKESMVLKVQNDRSNKDIVELGSELCDEEVCIDWPILKLAKVESIWGGDDKIVRKMEGDDDIIVKDMTEEEKRQWQAHVNQLSERMMTRYAIEIAGQRDEKGKHVRPALAWVRKFTGLVYETIQGPNGEAPMLKAVKQWSNPTSLVPVLLPLVVKDVLLENSRLLADLPVPLAYPLQSVVWLTDTAAALFGMPAMVSGYQNEDKPTCRLEIVGMTVDNKVERLEALRKRADQCSLRWMAGFECARQCQVDVRFFSRITGTMMLWNEPRERVEKGQQLSSDSKINCGMGLKFSRRDMCLADFTDRIETTNNRGVTAKQWFYSPLVCTLSWEYKKKFPELWNYLEAAGNNQVDDVYYAEEVWRNEETRNTRFNELKEFLSTLPSQEAEQFKCGTEYADRRMIAEIEKVIQMPDKVPRGMNKSYVPPSSVFRYELYDGKVQVDPEADFLILDRVNLMCPNSKLQKVIQGTVVGIHDDKIDVLFDKEFEGGSKVRNSTLASAYRAPRTALINVTYGLLRKKAHKKEMKKQEALALDGAYVPMKQKNNFKQKEKETKQKSHAETPSTSKSQKKENQKQSKKDKKSDNVENPKHSNKKDKKFDNVVLATRKSEDTPEALTDSLNKLLNIKPKPSEEPSSSSAAPGKPVSLIELLGGAGGKKTAATGNKQHAPKKPHGSKSLEEIEAGAGASTSTKEPEKEDAMSSLLRQLSSAQNAQNGSKNQPKQQKNKGWQKKDEGWWQAKKNAPKDNNKNQNPKQKVEILRKPSAEQEAQAQQPQKTVQNAPQKKKTPSPPVDKQAQRAKTPSPQLFQQKPQGAPFGMPPPNFSMPPPPMMHVFPGMVPMGMHLGGPMGMPMMQPHFPHQQMGFDGRRQNPTLTDFKPSVISRNHRASNQPPKVTMITKRKSVTPPPQDAPEEPPKPMETVQEPSGEKVKKPRKKKQSRLAVNFSNPSPSS